MYHIHFCLIRKILSLYLYDKVWENDNDFSSQLKGFYTTEKWSVERRLRSGKKYVFFF